MGLLCPYGAFRFRQRYLSIFNPASSLSWSGNQTGLQFCETVPSDQQTLWIGSGLCPPTPTGNTSMTGSRATRNTTGAMPNTVVHVLGAAPTFVGPSGPPILPPALELTEGVKLDNYYTILHDHA